MESCRSVFLAILCSVMTRRPRCVVASGGRLFQQPTAALIGLLFVSEINIKKKGPPRMVTNGDPSRRHRALGAAWSVAMESTKPTLWRSCCCCRSKIFTAILLVMMKSGLFTGRCTQPPFP